MNRLSAMETFIRVIDACSFSNGARRPAAAVAVRGSAWHATAAALNPDRRDQLLSQRGMMDHETASSA
jgi:hypothetical protein